MLSFLCRTGVRSWELQEDYPSDAGAAL